MSARLLEDYPISILPEGKYVAISGTPGKETRSLSYLVSDY